MENLNLILKWLGITLESGAEESPLFLLSLCVFLFSIVALVCFIQIIFYLVVLLLFENKTFLERFSKYNILMKIVTFYKGFSMLNLFIEIFIFIFCFGSIIWFTGRVLFIFIK